jgi:hypothetical protein
MSKLTPEHDSRHPDSDSYSEVTAAYKYVDSVLSTADAQSPVNGLAWHGWALREAFLAGCTHAAEQLRTTRRPKPPSLKEQALADLDSMAIKPCWINGIDANALVRAKYDNIRLALEALDD